MRPTGLTGVKFRSLEALVPLFESSRQDLHDGHGFSEFVVLRFFLWFCMQIVTFCVGAFFKGNCTAWILDLRDSSILDCGHGGNGVKRCSGNFASQT